MIIEEFHTYTYQLPLVNPLQIGKSHNTSRSGIIIYLKTNTHRGGFGEAAPLPGLHQENIEIVKRQVLELKARLQGSHHENWFSILDELYKKNNISSSLQFAIESAIINIDEEDNLLDRKKILPDPVHNKIYVNALVTEDESKIFRKIEKCISDNYRSIKIKVGRIPINAEFKLLKNIRDLIGAKITLRLDANQAWDLEEAETYVNSIKELDIEYIEEPLMNPAKLPELFERTGLRIALDESLTNMPPESIKPANWINTLILKPSVIGSVRKTLHYINRAQELRLNVVVSDTFHSGIGLGFLIRLASIIPKTTPMGFDTYSWLKDDVLVDRLSLSVDEGCFDLKTVMNLCRRVDFSKLKKV